MRIIYNIAPFLSSQSGTTEQGKTAEFQILVKNKIIGKYRNDIRYAIHDS